MLTIMFLTFVYTSVIRNRDLKVLQATAQRWMIKGHGGISYKIIFTPRRKKEMLNVDSVWIHNKPYKATVTEQSETTECTGNVMSIDLSEGLPASNGAVDSLPKEIPVKKGDAVIVYTIGEKKRYHIIQQLQQLPFLIAN